MSCSEKLKLELARNALMQCFSVIVSIHQIEALLEGINFHISGFEMFPAVSKLLKHPPSTFSKWKKNPTIFSSKSLPLKI